MSTLPQVSVVMPTFEQCHFIRRALDSLMAQTLSTWELQPCLADPRVRCIHMLHNQGLGRALNVGLARAQAPLVAYLPHTALRWTTRDEVESDDLEILFWSKLRAAGLLVGSGAVMEHPYWYNTERMQALRARMWNARSLFTFDYHVPALADFFREVIDSAGRSRSTA